MTPAWLARWVADTKQVSRERKVHSDGDVQKEVSEESFMMDVLDAGLCCAIFLGTAGMAMARKLSGPER